MPEKKLEFSDKIRQERILAGRPASFWKELVENRDLEATPKRPPVATPVIERLPKDQLDQILRNLRGWDELALKTLKTISRDIQSLNEEDAIKIIETAINETYGSIRHEAYELLSALPVECRTKIVEELISKKIYDHRAIEFIPSFSKEKRLKLMMHIFSSQNTPAILEALKIIGKFPAEERFKLMMTALSSQNYAVELEACKLIPHLQFTDEEQQQLVRTAFESPHHAIIFEASKLVLDFPKNDETAELWKKALRSIKITLSSGNEFAEPELCELIPKVRTEEQPELIIGLLKSRHSNIALKAVELALRLPKEFRTTEVWSAVSEAIVAALKVRACPYQSNVNYADSTALTAYRLINNLPKEYRLGPVKEALESANEIIKDESVTLETISLIPTIPEKDQPKLWKTASGKLLASLKSVNQNIRQKAIRAISVFPTEEQSVLIKDAIKSQYKDIQVKCSELIAAAPPETRPQLIEYALEAPHSELRLKAVELISTAPEECHIKLLKRALDCEYHDVRIQATKTIATLPVEKQSCLLSIALRSDVAEVRHEGAKLVLSLPKEARTADLLEALPAVVRLGVKSDDEGIWVQSSELIPALPKEQQTEKLWKESYRKIKRSLKSQNYEIRTKAVALIQTFPRGYQDKLIDSALNCRHIDVRQKALEFVFDTTTIRLMTKLRIALNSAYSDVHFKSIELLSDIVRHYPKWNTEYWDEHWNIAVKRIKSAINSEDWDTRSKAFALLPLFPSYYQFKIIKSAVKQDYPSIALEAIRLIPHRPANEQAVLWKTATKGIRRCLELECTYRDAIELIPTFPLELQHSLWEQACLKFSGYIYRDTLALIGVFPEEYRVRIIKRVLRSGYADEDTRLSAAALIPTLQEKEQPTGMWKVVPGSIRTKFNSPAALWKIASKTLVKVLESSKPDSQKKAVELIPLMPMEQQLKLVKHMLNSKSHEIFLKGVEMIPSFSQEKQTEFWKIAFERCESLIGNADFSLKACALIEIFPEEQQLGLLNAALNSKHENTQLKAIEFIPKIRDNSKEYREWKEYLWKVGWEKIKAALSSPDSSISMSASMCISSFPADQQLELIKLALDSSHEGTVLNGVCALNQLPLFESSEETARQTKELWGMASSRIERILNSEDKLNRERAVYLITKFPDTQQLQIFGAALDSKHEDIKSKAADLFVSAAKEEDLKQNLFKHAFSSPYEDVQLKAIQLIRTLPENEQALMIEEAFRNSIYVSVLTETVKLISCLPDSYAATKTSLFEEVARRVKKELDSPDLDTSLNALKLVPSFPDDRQPELFKCAFGSPHSAVRLKALELIESVSEEQQPHILKLAMQTLKEPMETMALMGIPKGKVPIIINDRVALLVNENVFSKAVNSIFAEVERRANGENSID
ncbi:MAG: hypothetical protein QXT45_06485 [Candidatus Bilamarchaeaceae archaeon]